MDGGSQYAHRVDAAMLIETIVFGGQNRLFHDFGYVLDTYECTPLFAELTNQMTICRIDAQRNFWSVISENVE